MVKRNTLKDMYQDIRDIRSVIKFTNGDTGTKEIIKNQARAIMLNLHDHLQELLES